MTPSKAESKPAAPTEYVVLERLPANEGENAVKHMNGDDVAGTEVWLPVGKTSGHGQERALIEKWAGEQKRSGEFKLVSARAWKGGARIFEQTRMASEAL